MSRNDTLRNRRIFDRILELDPAKKTFDLDLATVKSMVADALKENESNRYHHLPLAREHAANARREDAAQRYRSIRPLVLQLRGEKKSYREIADTLETMGINAPKGGRWNQMTVQRIEKFTE